MRGKDTFWLENPYQLVADPRVIPTDGMTLEAKLNSISRLIIIVAVILYLLGYKESPLFILLALTIIIILYYLEKGKMSTAENFSCNIGKGLQAFKQLEDHVVSLQKCSMAAKEGAQKPTHNDFDVTFDDRYYSKNRALAGGPNPKTLVQPILPHRAYDWQVWRNNDYNNFSSQINNRTRQFLYENGYLEQTPECGGNKTCLNLKDAGPAEYVPRPERKSAVKEGFKMSKEKFVNYDVPPVTKDAQYIDFNKGNDTNIRAGDLNTMCGYRPENSEYDMPVNYGSSIMQRKKEMKDYNRQIFTQQAGEDVYQYNQIVEPDNWNIGISFNQQFPPTTLDVNESGFHFQEHDPRTFKVPQGEIIDPFTMDPKPEDVYDPRQTGYGPNYRSYVDPMTGQPRFYYDDVIAVRKSNFITRNKIDHIPGLNQTGVMKTNEDLFAATAEVRKRANDNFMDSMITQRVELQQRLMRKRNSDWWQRKAAPIYSSRGGGGGGSC